MATENVIYAVEALLYLVLFAIVVFTLRGIRLELKRIADRLDEPVEEPD